MGSALFHRRQFARTSRQRSRKRTGRTTTRRRASHGRRSARTRVARSDRSATSSSERRMAPWVASPLHIRSSTRSAVVPLAWTTAADRRAQRRTGTADSSAASSKVRRRSSRSALARPKLGSTSGCSSSVSMERSRTTTRKRRTSSSRCQSRFHRVPERREQRWRDHEQGSRSFAQCTRDRQAHVPLGSRGDVGQEQERARRAAGRRLRRYHGRVRSQHCSQGTAVRRVLRH